MPKEGLTEAGAVQTDTVGGHVVVIVWSPGTGLGLDAGDISAVLGQLLQGTCQPRDQDEISKLARVLLKDGGVWRVVC